MPLALYFKKRVHEKLKFQNPPAWPARLNYRSVDDNFTRPNIHPSEVPAPEPFRYFVTQGLARILKTGD